MQRFAIAIAHQHLVAGMHVAQPPENCWIPSWTIRVPINYRTPTLARTGTYGIPAYTIPRVRRWRRQVTTREDTNLLNRRVDTNCGNSQVDKRRHQLSRGCRNEGPRSRVYWC